MAQKITLVDDLDGQQPATQTVHFSYRGKDYAIDLSDEHAAEFDDALARYLDAARDTTQPSPPTRRTKQTRGRSAQETANIREWARERDMQVGDRGRIPRTVLEQYDLAKSRGEV